MKIVERKIEEKCDCVVEVVRRWMGEEIRVLVVENEYPGDLYDEMGRVLGERYAEVCYGVGYWVVHGIELLVKDSSYVDWLRGVYIAVNKKYDKDFNVYVLDGELEYLV